MKEVSIETDVLMQHEDQSRLLSTLKKSRISLLYECLIKVVDMIMIDEFLEVASRIPTINELVVLNTASKEEPLCSTPLLEKIIGKDVGNHNPGDSKIFWSFQLRETG